MEYYTSTKKAMAVLHEWKSHAALRGDAGGSWSGVCVTRRSLATHGCSSQAHFFLLPRKSGGGSRGGRAGWRRQDSTSTSWRGAAARTGAGLESVSSPRSYNPFDGPNENPEAELPLTAGKYLYVHGDMDEDGFYEGLCRHQPPSGAQPGHPGQRAGAGDSGSLQDRQAERGLRVTTPGLTGLCPRASFGTHGSRSQGPRGYRVGRRSGPSQEVAPLLRAYAHPHCPPSPAGARGATTTPAPWAVAAPRPAGRAKEKPSHAQDRAVLPLIPPSWLGTLWTPRTDCSQRSLLPHPPAPAPQTLGCILRQGQGHLGGLTESASRHLQRAGPPILRLSLCQGVWPIPGRIAPLHTTLPSPARDQAP